MEEDNDDQWLYGEETTAENTSVNEKTNDASNVEPFSEENTVDRNELEPPIIKPPATAAFDDADVVPGEEELMVPLNPPVISAPETSESQEDAHENNELVNGEATNGQQPTDGENAKEKSEGEEDEDDNVNVVIGDIHQKSSTSYTAPANLHIKRGNLLTLTKQQGKFATDDFETVGVINGVAAHEFNLDNLEDKPWRKPGADITDYFNYGFNEETWRAYCERQKKMRVHESGSGLIPMNQTTNNVNIIPNMSVPPPNMLPPMGINNVPDMGSGSINVIGGMNTRRPDNFAKENTIQVMTADRREYSKKNFTPDMSVPPPVLPPPFGTLPPGIPPPFPPMNQYGPPPGEYFPPEMDPYFHPYEPPQDPAWSAQNWNSNIDVKNMIPLSNGSGPPPRSVNGTPESKPSTSEDAAAPAVKVKAEPEDREITHERDRERDRDKSRDYDRDRESRHRSHRHRSRSRSHERRSRKHKSRSRSPSYRHKKKKSKKSERSKSESE